MHDTSTYGYDLGITRIEAVEFAYPLEDIAKRGHTFVYLPGATTEQLTYATRIKTDIGMTRCAACRRRTHRTPAETLRKDTQTTVLSRRHGI